MRSLPACGAAVAGRPQNVSEDRSTAGRFDGDPRRREQLIRQVIRARRSVDAERADTTATGDLAKVALAERAKQWVHPDPPHTAH